MTASVTTESIVVFLSVATLVIIELSSVTRGMELSSMSNESRDPIVLAGILPVPNLGRFVFIHGLNLFILSFSTLLVLYFTNGIIGALLLTLILGLFSILPFIEVDEYDQLITDGGKTKSMRAHTSFVVISLILIFLLPPVDTLLPNQISSEAVEFVIALLFFLPAGATYIFTIHLEEDLSYRGSKSDSSRGIQ